jgi:hypothetical protein
MSTTDSNKTSATSKSQHSPVPDGKSDLPIVLPDFPPPGSTEPDPPAAANTKPKTK